MSVNISKKQQQNMEVARRIVVTVLEENGINCDRVISPMALPISLSYSVNEPEGISVDINTERLCKNANKAWKIINRVLKALESKFEVRREFIYDFLCITLIKSK